MKMGIFSALIYHMVPGNFGQKASSLMNLYICGSHPLTNNLRLSWLLKVFVIELVPFQEGARYRFCFYLHQVRSFNGNSGISVKLTSEFWPILKFY